MCPCARRAQDNFFPRHFSLFFIVLFNNKIFRGLEALHHTSTIGSSPPFIEITPPSPLPHERMTTWRPPWHSPLPMTLYPLYKSARAAVGGLSPTRDNKLQGVIRGGGRRDDEPLWQYASPGKLRVSRIMATKTDARVRITTGVYKGKGLDSTVVVQE